MFRLLDEYNNTSSLKAFYNIITSDTYSKDFKNFVMPFEPEFYQIERTFGKYINVDKENFKYEHR